LNYKCRRDERDEEEEEERNKTGEGEEAGIIVAQ
jgi:hypothetical protein